MTHTDTHSRLDARLLSLREHRPILAAIGPSGGDAILRTARDIAARRGSPGIVASIVDAPPFDVFSAAPPPMSGALIDDQLRNRRMHLQDMARELGPWPPDSADAAVEVGFGDVSASLVDLAKERDAQLIVMGSGPPGRRTRLFAAETSLATMRRAPCAVLAVRAGAPSFAKVVVIATDFSPGSIHAALEALPLLEERAVVLLVHAWRRIHTPYPSETLRNVDEAYERALPTRFQRMRDALEDAIGHEKHIEFHFLSREGHSAQVILGAARDVGAELIVAGTRGHGLVERLLIGSVSTALVRGAQCSVLVVPPPSGLERARLERLMTGTSSVRAPEIWAQELESFARRNRQRRTWLEVHDRTLGAQVQEFGFALAGASYDPHDRRVELMFEKPAHAGDHFSRGIGGVSSVAVATDAHAMDEALYIEARASTALLRFLPPDPAAPE
jgi:nucleotide-binding universal stress UspA family protein